MPTAIQQLLKENETQLLCERRVADRTPFVRPAVIRSMRGDEVIHGFTRDISSLGVGIVCPRPWKPPAIVNLEIHSLKTKQLKFKAEARWCDHYGDGWYLIGFVFR